MDASLYGYELYEKMETFLLEKCANASFLDINHISILYGDVVNTNLTKIHDQVYLYPGLTEIGPKN